MTGSRIIARRLAILAACALWVAGGVPSDAAAPSPDSHVLVFAAASLKEALDDADAAYQHDTGMPVAASYAASGTLAKQIDNGAPADLFISADLDWMDTLGKKSLIQADGRVTLLGNSLVLVAPAESSLEVTLAPGLHLAPALGTGRLAIGDPQYVPAGKYAQQSLEKLGAWDEVQDHLARADSVRAALALVSRHEAPLGIVYATDAPADPGVKIVATFPEDSHPPIVYPAALLTSSHNPAAAKFFAWLKSGKAKPYFTRRGFTIQDVAAAK